MTLRPASSSDLLNYLRTQIDHQTGANLVDLGIVILSDIHLKAATFDVTYHPISNAHFVELKKMTDVVNGYIPYRGIFPGSCVRLNAHPSHGTWSPDKMKNVTPEQRRRALALYLDHKGFTEKIHEGGSKILPPDGRFHSEQDSFPERRQRSNFVHETDNYPAPNSRCEPIEKADAEYCTWMDALIASIGATPIDKSTALRNWHGARKAAHLIRDLALEYMGNGGKVKVGNDQGFIIHNASRDDIQQWLKRVVDRLDRYDRMINMRGAQIA